MLVGGRGKAGGILLAKNPAEAEEGTIRQKYATSLGENAVHGSDSDENAEIEGSFHFAMTDRF